MKEWSIFLRRENLWKKQEAVMLSSGLLRSDTLQIFRNFAQMAHSSILHGRHLNYNFHRSRILHHAGGGPFQILQYCPTKLEFMPKFSKTLLVQENI